MNDPKVKTYVCNNGSSTIDLCFTNAPNRLHNFTIRESHWTKHRLVTMTIETNIGLKERMDNTIVKINPDVLSHEILKIDLNQSCDAINHQLICALSSSKLSQRRKSKPWFDSELHQLHIKLKHDYKIGKFEYSESNRNQFVETKKIFKHLCRRK